MKKFLKDISYDDRNFLAIGISFISNLIFLNIKNKEKSLSIYEILNLNSYEILSKVFIIFLNLMSIVLLIFVIIISIDIILNSLEIFNKIISLGNIIVIFIISNYGLNSSLKGFEILILTLFIIGLLFKVLDNKNSNK